MENTLIETENDYTQLCLWQGCIVGNEEKQNKFVEFMQKEFKARVKYAEEIVTKGNEDGEGGRNDLLFYIHSEDIPIFAVPRLEYGISWWEDARNRMRSIYPSEIFTKYPKTW